MSIWLQIPLHFAIWSVLSVGGSNVTLSDMHRYMVEQHHWLSDADFVAYFSLSRAAPGPNGLAVEMIGLHVAGIGGAVLATLATLLPSALIAYFGGGWYDRSQHLPSVQMVKTALVPVTVALLICSGLVLAQSVDTRWPHLALTLAGTFAAYESRLNPLWLIFIAAVIGLVSGLTGMNIF